MSLPGRHMDSVDALCATMLADMRAGDPARLNRLFAEAGKPAPRVVWTPTAETPMDPGLGISSAIGRL